MPVVKGVGKPCAGEPHARFEEPETEQAMAVDSWQPSGNRGT